jgi:hypothetical protein
VKVEQFLKQGVSEDQVDDWVQTISILYSNDNALDIAVRDDRIVGVRGRGVDRVNKGRVDPKDLFGWQANNSGDRLKRPLVRKNNELVETSWDEAMGCIVERSKKLLGEKGPLAFGFYTTGQLFLEEYYTLGVIGKAGLGTPHMDGNTRLCTATAADALTNQKRGVRRYPCAETGRPPCSSCSSLYALAPPRRAWRRRTRTGRVRLCSGSSRRSSPGLPSGPAREPLRGAGPPPNRRRPGAAPRAL